VELLVLQRGSVEGEMSEQGGAVVVCIFITEGECVRSVWVLVGSIGGLGLG
jgi:hypothetical protein